MKPGEAERLRGEILAELAPVLVGELAAAEWGRILVEVVESPDGQAVVAGIDVDEIIGDEARVDAVFGAASTRAVLPVLAHATEALCALEGVALDDVRGGTFIRSGEGFVWLPGLVRAPSPKLDAERDHVVARLRAKNDGLRARFPADQFEFDVERGMLRWRRAGQEIGAARATLLGTFASRPRVWAWAWNNPSLAESTRRASAAVADGLEERDLWEISTPAFATDVETAWAITAFVCDRARGEGVQQLAREDGALFVLLHDARGM